MAQMFSADYSAIEARIVCWLAGQEDALQQYREGVDRYRIMACSIFGIRNPADVNEFPQRFIGKQAILGCGYQMSGAKFRITVEKFGYKDMPEGLEHKAVKAFRDTHPAIVKLWKDTEQAARSAIATTHKYFTAGKMSFISRKVAGMKYLFLRLPSGREIAYPQPRLEPCLRYTYKGLGVQIINPKPDDIARADKRVGQSRRHGDGGYSLKDVITFFGKQGTSRAWGRVQTYGAKLVENGTQGTAADVMSEGCRNAESVGYQSATLIHDEVLAYCDPIMGQSVEDLCKQLTTLGSWAAGLPIAAEGKTVKYYTK